MNWDDDGWNPYRRRNPYGDRWGKWTPKKSSEELNGMIKKAWEKIEQWVPERDPALTESLTLTPDWSDVEKLYKHITRLYKHIAVLHDDIERLKRAKIYPVEPMLKRHRLTAKEKGLSKKGIDKEIKHLKSMGYHPSPTAFGRKPKKKKKRIKKK